MIKKELVFATLFDSAYLLQGLALIDSIIKNYSESRVYLALLDELSIITMKEKYGDNPRVFFDNGDIRNECEFRVRNFEKRSEVIFSLKPTLIERAMSEIKADMYFYCDADLYFFNRFEFDYKQEDIILSEHIFSNRQKTHLINGTFNAGLVGFSRSASSIRCLQWWTERCRESTRHAPMDGIVGDQKYLEHFSELSDSVKVFRSPSLNQSVWMLDDESIISHGPTIDGSLVSSYHFHRVKTYKLLIKTGINQYGKLSCAKGLLQFVYNPYISKLRENKIFIGAKNLKLPSLKVTDLKRFEWVRF